ncbi:hypothetical protein ZIOFF_066343 [Zingiber officinale]|uniref:NB-ARC domain-containing protein n=1 Tax=Zingiber officinale TaxID=94328 RepID=A0A8J5KC17_ZINOF|nr:hypothetical protein ZIOFF_066343 [Zingiber officinale]
MRELEKTMKRIQAKIVNLELEEKYKSESEKFWFSELKEVVYDAQDIVEEYGYEELHSKLKMAKESSNDKYKVNYEELDELQHALQQKLQGKKFLLIIDDVWDDNFALWEQVTTVGKIIVTTRSESVAKVMETPGYGLKLNVLPFDVCWSLFKRIAFEG